MNRSFPVTDFNGHKIVIISNNLYIKKHFFSGKLFSLQ